MAISFSPQAAHGQKPTDLSQLRDITGIEEVAPPPAASRWPYWFALATLSVLGVALVSWRLAQRRRAVAAPPLPADVWALRELERIAELKLAEAGGVERLHTLLSDVVRHYLERRFELRAPRQTTIEFLETMRASPKLTASQQDLLREFLERCDLAKFARAAATLEECAATAAMARRFVAETALNPMMRTGAS